MFKLKRKNSMVTVADDDLFCIVAMQLLMISSPLLPRF